MYQTHKVRTLTKETIENYMAALQEDEKSSATVAKYTHDLNMAAEYFAGVSIIIFCAGADWLEASSLLLDGSYSDTGK